MTYTYDPPRVVRTVRRNGLPIGNLFPNPDGYRFEPYLRGQLDNQHFDNLIELEETLEPVLKRKYEDAFTRRDLRAKVRLAPNKKERDEAEAALVRFLQRKNRI